MEVLEIIFWFTVGSTVTAAYFGLRFFKAASTPKKDVFTGNGHTTANAFMKRLTEKGYATVKLSGKDKFVIAVLDSKTMSVYVALRTSSSDYAPFQVRLITLSELLYKLERFKVYGTKSKTTVSFFNKVLSEYREFDKLNDPNITITQVQELAREVHGGIELANSMGLHFEARAFQKRKLELLEKIKELADNF